MERKYLMKCGHIANAELHKDNGFIPACIICDCYEIDKECKNNEGLEGRTAICTGHNNLSGCGDGTTNSRWSLPFFKYCPNKPNDEYYCGCWGWN